MSINQLLPTIYGQLTGDKIFVDAQQPSNFCKCVKTFEGKLNVKTSVCAF